METGRRGTVPARFLRPSGVPPPTPDPGLDGARCLKKGFVVVLPIEQKETGLEVALLTSARTKFGSLAAFLSV